MKKIVSVFLTLAVALTFAGIACKTTGGDKNPIKDAETYSTGRWVKCQNPAWKGKDCFQLRQSADVPSGINKATGKPWSESGKFTQRNASREAARMMAIKEILAFIKGEKVSAAAGVANFEVTGQAIATECEGSVNGAFVIEESYDEGTNACSLKVEVQLDKAKFTKGSKIE